MPDATAAVFPDALTQDTLLVVVLTARKYCVLCCRVQALPPPVLITCGAITLGEPILPEPGRLNVACLVAIAPPGVGLGDPRNNSTSTMALGIAAVKPLRKTDRLSIVKEVPEPVVKTTPILPPPISYPE
jgi:hypothetical protein